MPGTDILRTTWSSTDPAPWSESEAYYFTRDPIRLVARKSGNAFVVRYTLAGDLPFSASAGQSGPFATGTPDQTTQSERVNWKVEASEMPQSAWVCLEFTQIRSRFSHCVRVAANGALLGRRHVVEAALQPPIDMR